MTPEAADEILAAERACAVALGPGWGGPRARARSSASCSTGFEKPIVLEPTGSAVAGHLDWIFAREAATVLTPHADESGRLLGRPSSCG